MLKKGIDTRTNCEFMIHKFNTSDTTTKKKNIRTLIFFQTLSRNIKTKCVF